MNAHAAPTPCVCVCVSVWAWGGANVSVHVYTCEHASVWSVGVWVGGCLSAYVFAYSMCVYGR